MTPGEGPHLQAGVAESTLLRTSWWPQPQGPFCAGAGWQSPLCRGPAGGLQPQGPSDTASPLVPSSKQTTALTHPAFASLRSPPGPQPSWGRVPGQHHMSWQDRVPRAATSSVSPELPWPGSCLGVTSHSGGPGPSASPGPGLEERLCAVTASQPPGGPWWAAHGDTQAQEEGRGALGTSSQAVGTPCFLSRAPSQADTAQPPEAEAEAAAASLTLS